MEQPRTITLANGSTIALPLFRDQIPLYAAPDREKWQRKHGLAPFLITGLRELEPSLFTKAAAAVEKDRTAIDFDAAIAAHSKLDLLNQDAAFMLGDDRFVGIVCYDPTDGEFYGYPEKIP